MAKAQQQKQNEMVRPEIAQQRPTALMLCASGLKWSLRNLGSSGRRVYPVYSSRCRMPLGRRGPPQSN